MADTAGVETTPRTTRKTTRKPAVRKAKAAVRKTTARARKAAPRKPAVSIERVQDTMKEVAYVQLGIAGRVYDEFTARATKARKDAPKQWVALVKRGERVQKDLEKAGKELRSDLQSRVDTITGLFAVNRRGGAAWALVVEPGAAHVVGQSRDLGALFFEEMLASPKGAGFVGDLKTFEIQPAASPGTPGTPNAWLQTERLAKAWQAVVKKGP